MGRIGELWNHAQQDTIFRGHSAADVRAPHEGAADSPRIADSPRRICRFAEKNQPIRQEELHG